MNLLTIAWRSLQQRWLASSLTAFSMALGVTLIVAVVTIHGIVTAQFRNNATLGYNMIVGATKGGRLQLTLNSVYYLSQPVENIGYDYYLEFLPQEQRAEQLENSYAYQAHQATWQALGLSSSLQSLALPGALGGALTAANHAERMAARPLHRHRGGRFSDWTAFAVPICMGDYYGRFRVVGTTPDMFDVLPEAAGKSFSFAAGRNFKTWTSEHGYFEAVVGSTVARERNVKPGDQVFPSHGDPDGHSHENGFTVVGVLAPTGTPNDRAVFVNIEGFYLMSDHAKPLPDEEQQDEQGFGDAGGNQDDDTSGGEEALVEGEPPSRVADEDPRASQSAASSQLQLKPLPVEQREVTALLLRTITPFVAQGLHNTINEGNEAQAVQPIKEIYELLDMIVTPLQQLLLLLTMMIVIVSGVSILVSIYNSMSERRHEIAVMRALGARRGTVMWIILLESMMLSVGGGLLGWAMGHGLNWLASTEIENRTGVAIGLLDFAPPVNLFEFLGMQATAEWMSKVVVYPELLLIPVLMLLAMLVGLLPALAAYRTDVADSLGK